MTRHYLPGATIGLMGSGQLGRMFAIAARRMGYRIHVFSPEKDTPAGQFADREVTGAYEDESAVREFAKGLDLAHLRVRKHSAPNRRLVRSRMRSPSGQLGPAHRAESASRKIFFQAPASLSRLTERCTARPS
jgi:D-arabinose 1-dehydrogenase-like Zn-dependent alcohol dehydrogenase